MKISIIRLPVRSSTIRKRYGDAVGKRIAVVCAAIERGALVLAARRRPRQTNGGLWEFPGGKVQGGESLTAALAREVAEELGVAVSIRHAMEPVEWDYPWVAIALHPFVCSLNGSAEPEPLDHEELRFVSRDDARILPWAPADREVVDRYFQVSGNPPL